jgi:hypothetical protein
MRGRLSAILVLLVGGSFSVGSPSLAQQADPFRPYPTGGSRSSTTRTYEQPRPQVVAQPPARSQGVREYFPGMRTGRGPNRNVVDTRKLCVPGRRAMISTAATGGMLMNGMSPGMAAGAMGAVPGAGAGLGPTVPGPR